MEEIGKEMNRKSAVDFNRTFFAFNDDVPVLAEA